ncbi:putative transcription factor interactor and regulator CCHC(Zn) family [Helianthus debilis subsp. tardiflorus]
MVFLASILKSYESLVDEKIGNTNLTKVDYCQIDPEEMELIDIRWCMASVIRRAQKFMEITRRNSIVSPSTKLGFDKSKVTCFKCKQKGHFKRECRNSAANKTANSFHDDYYGKAVYHRNQEEPSKMKQVEDNPKEKSRALAVIQDDEVLIGANFFPKRMRSVMLFWQTLNNQHHQLTIGKEDWHKFRRKRSILLTKKPKRRKDGIRIVSVTWIQRVTSILIQKPLMWKL